MGPDNDGEERGKDEVDFHLDHGPVGREDVGIFANVLEGGAVALQGVKEGVERVHHEMVE